MISVRLNRRVLAGAMEAFDSAIESSATRLGQVTGVTDYLGQVRVRLPLAACKGPGIVGPRRVHRISNRPEYWDVTYAPAHIRVEATKASAVSFVHVCKEINRGSRP